MRCICIFLLIFFAYSSFAQVITRSDSTYVEVKEDSSNRKEVLDKHVDYEIYVYLFGFFDNDTVKITKNDKICYSNIISTRKKNGDYETMIYRDSKLLLKIRKREKNIFKLFFNGKSIDLLFRYGYADLTVDVSYKYDKLINEKIPSFIIEYKNDFYVRTL